MGLWRRGADGDDADDRACASAPTSVNPRTAPLDLVAYTPLPAGDRAGLGSRSARRVAGRGRTLRDRCPLPRCHRLRACVRSAKAPQKGRAQRDRQTRPSRRPDPGIGPLAHAATSPGARGVSPGRRCKASLCLLVAEATALAIGKRRRFGPARRGARMFLKRGTEAPRAQPWEGDAALTTHRLQEEPWSL